MKQKYLILNADDFGMCHSYNQAIFDLLEAGAITSSTLMPVAPARDEAAAWCVRHNVRVVGLHLTLTSEWPAWRWPSLTGAPSLADETGNLWRNCALLWAHARPEEVAGELDAQFAWFARSGVFFSHADNHMGSVYPQPGGGAPDYLPLVFARCQRYGIGFRMYSQSYWQPELTISRQAAEADISLAETLGVALVDHLFAFPFSSPPEAGYDDVKRAACRLLYELPDGVSELYFHPSVESDELKRIVPSWRRRVWDYRLLLDDDFRFAIRDAGITLINYRQMAALRR